MTVLFADVVHSMDIAKAVGGADCGDHGRLLDRLTAVVGRYGGTVDKFTGDGCHGRCSGPGGSGGPRHAGVRRGRPGHPPRSAIWPRRSSDDGLELQVRIGLNSGQVIAGRSAQAGPATPPSANGSAWPNA